MPPSSWEQTTLALADLGRGDRSAADRLLPLVYAELRALAGSYLRGQAHGHTLEPTALVHEAYLKLADQTEARWQDRAHFIAVAATAMRQVLVDHAHKRRALKRGGDRRRVTLRTDHGPAFELDTDLLALDEALQTLAGLDDRKARVVEARFFGGLSMADIAHVLGVSKTTVESDWRLARAWLSRALAAGGDA